ncbi:MAG: anti-sigma factor [Acidobacteriota bacterium]|nr:anti-sigma factor [Acidobacteriota bacterium]
MSDPRQPKAMDHPRIDDEHVLDRYLAGRLAPEDEALFEEHLFECGECLEAVQAGEELRRGLQQVAAEDGTPNAAPEGLPRALESATETGALAWLRSRRPPQLMGLLAVALALVVMPVLLLRQGAELDRLEQENARLTAAGGGQSEPGVWTLAEPLANLAVVSLGVSRDAGGTVEIRPDPQSDALLLSLELPAVDAAHYRVDLRDTAGETLWSSGELEPTLYDTLLVALPPSFLPPGEYRIEIHRAPSESSAPAAEMAFRVLAPSAGDPPESP